MLNFKRAIMCVFVYDACAAEYYAFLVRFFVVAVVITIVVLYISEKIKIRII